MACRAVMACRAATACRAVTACRRAEPARRDRARPGGRAPPPRRPATLASVATPGPSATLARLATAWDPADPSGQAAPCPRATRPTRRPALRVRAAPRIAPPDGMRAVPDTPPRAAAGQGRRDTRAPLGAARLASGTSRSMADTRRSSARRITRSVRQARSVRRAPAVPPNRPGHLRRPVPPTCSSTGTPATSRHRTGPERRRLLVRPARGGRRARCPGTRGRGDAGTVRAAGVIRRSAGPGPPCLQRHPTPPAPIRRRMPPGRTTA